MDRTKEPSSILHINTEVTGVSNIYVVGRAVYGPSTAKIRFKLVVCGGEVITGNTEEQKRLTVD